MPVIFLVILLLCLASTVNTATVRCTILHHICETHIASQQEFCYESCALSATVRHGLIFGEDELYLVSKPPYWGSYSPGQQLTLRVRNASTPGAALTNQSAHTHSRRLGTTVSTNPMWHYSGRGVHVEMVLTARTPSRRRLGYSSPSTGATATRGRTLLTLCLQYVRSTHTCSAGDEAWSHNVPQTLARVAYNRLDPAWDQPNSRFYIIKMDDANDYPHPQDIEEFSCESFLAGEPPFALARAKALYADARLHYSHIEYIVPTNLHKCEWGGIGTVGTYAPQGDPSVPIPGGVTHVKGPGMVVRRGPHIYRAYHDDARSSP